MSMEEMEKANESISIPPLPIFEEDPLLNCLAAGDMNEVSVDPEERSGAERENVFISSSDSESEVSL